MFVSMIRNKLHGPQSYFKTAKVPVWQLSSADGMSSIRGLAGCCRTCSPVREQVCLLRMQCFVVLCAGRWKGALVAIKVVEHDMTGSSLVVEGARESLLAASIAHPNIVSPSPSRAPRSALPGVHGMHMYWSCLPWRINSNCCEALTASATKCVGVTLGA